MITFKLSGQCWNHSPINLQQCIILFRVCHCTDGMCRFSGRTNWHLSGKWMNPFLNQSSLIFTTIIGWFWRSIGDTKWEPLGSHWCHLLGQRLRRGKLPRSVCKCLWWGSFDFQHFEAVHRKICYIIHFSRTRLDCIHYSINWMSEKLKLIQEDTSPSVSVFWYTGLD